MTFTQIMTLSSIAESAPEDGTKLFRAVDGSPEFPGSHPYEMRCYIVLKRTPKGFWIDMNHAPKRFVRADGIKKFAHLTRAAAVESYIARKRSQAGFLIAQLRLTARRLNGANRTIGATPTAYEITLEDL